MPEVPASRESALSDSSALSALSPSHRIICFRNSFFVWVSSYLALVAFNQRCFHSHQAAVYVLGKMERNKKKKKKETPSQTLNLFRAKKQTKKSFLFRGNMRQHSSALIFPSGVVEATVKRWPVI